MYLTSLYSFTGKDDKRKKNGKNKGAGVMEVAGKLDLGQGGELPGTRPHVLPAPQQVCLTMYLTVMFGGLRGICHVESS